MMRDRNDPQFPSKVIFSDFLSPALGGPKGLTMKPLIHFLQQHLPSTTGFTGRLRIKPLKGDGSDRRVYRLFAGNRTSICVSHPNGCRGIPSENDSFVYIAEHLRTRGLPTPLIQAYDPGRGLFLMQDFGDFSLESVIKKIKEPKLIKRAYETILKLLLKIQIEGAKDFDSQYCYDTPLYNGRFAWERESRYFIEAFLKGYLGWKTVPPSAEKRIAGNSHGRGSGKEPVVSLPGFSIPKYHDLVRRDRID